MRYFVLLVLCGCPVVVPQPAREANELCAQLLAQGKLDEADAACDHSLEYQPKYWDALHNKGVIAQTRGDTKLAKKFYIEALRANQHMATSLNNLGGLEMNDGDLKGAIEHFRGALVVNPEYIEARYNLGTAHLQQRDFAAAAKDFRQMLLSNSSVVSAHLGLGSALMGLKEFDEACAVLERATTLDVGDDRAWLMRAACEKEQGRLDLVKESIERCLLANEKNLECQKVLKAIGD